MMALRLAGFSLFLFAELICFHGTILFPGLLGTSQEIAVAVMTVSLLSKGFGYFGCFFFSLVSASKQRQFGKVGALLFIVGILAMPGLGSVSSFADLSFGSLIELVIAGALLGVGDVLISISWGRLCAALPLRPAYLFVLGSQTAALVLYGVTFFLPDLAIVVSAIVAIVVVAAILIKLPDHSSVAFDGPRLRSVTSELWRPIFGTSVFAFLTGLMPWISGQYDGSIETMRLLSIGSSAVVLLLLAAPVAFFKQNMRLENIYKLILPIVATGFLLLPIIWNGFGGVVNAFVGAGSYAAGIVLWCLAADSSRRHNLSATTSFGLALGTTSLAGALGKAFGYFGGRTLTEGDLSITAISLVSLYLLSMIALFVFRKKPEQETGTPANEADRADELATNRAVPPVDPGGIPARIPGTSPNASSARNRSSESAADPASLRAATCATLADEHDLTDREHDVLMLLSRGQSVADIAAALGVSENTAKTHIKNVYRKLGVHSKQDIIEMCRELEAKAH
ncbi:LuxR C-terminal-related transcriptional regulator [Raoultibacter phocaeensis]|uniref:LuxR C-terminal-related transcriptional regulator n=1 Tax=Raoultibacter phocaeensis TaxID=2479841 RepID=UPI0011190E31|nr:LuxR C-terminal-related transcriptional regulator [Raoultibacter phocaeensis]